MVPDLHARGRRVVVVGGDCGGADVDGGARLRLLGYGCSVGMTLMLATGGHPLTAVGAGSFLVSDFLIALTTFVRPHRSRWAGCVFKATYLVGQLLIVSGTRARHDAGRGK
jgi:hypothetical protein